MKTKLLAVAAALIGAATLSAQAGVYVSFHLPLPVVVVRPPVPVVYTPPAVVVAPAAPVVCAPAAPVVVVQPPCPAPGYVWAPGYWGVGHVWAGGAWHPGPHVVAYDHPRYGHPYGWRR